jgi:hypothetical protein
MDDPYRDGIEPSKWNLDDFRKRREAEEKARQPKKPRRFTRTAAEMDLPHEVRSTLSRRGSHPSEWGPITSESELYNLRAGDNIQLFEKTRKGWVPLKALNGVHGGRKVLAFRRRTSRQRFNQLGGIERALAEQFAYNAAVQQVFFHRDLYAHVDKYGFPPRELRLKFLHRSSLQELNQKYDNAEPYIPPQHWICLSLRDTDGQPATGYPYRLRDSNGEERTGKLDRAGETHVANLADGPVEVSFGEPVDEQAIASQRQAIKQVLDTLVQAERAEAAQIKAEFQEKSLLGKMAALDGARAEGTRNAAWGILTGLKELSDLATQHVNHALTAAWESWRYSDEGHYAEQFARRFAEAEFQDLVDVLGFDPRSLTREQWAEALSLANFIWNDEETRKLLVDFAEDYIDAQHFLEVTETVSGLATEFAFELAITILTLGAGATVVAATKIRHVDKLKGVGRAFRQLAQTLKQRAGSKQGRGRTGEWHYQTLEKPEQRGIEKSDAVQNAVLREADNGAMMQVEYYAPNKTIRFTTEQAENLKSITRAEFDALQASGQSINKIGPALSVAQDLKTGRISPVFRNDPSGNIPDNLSDILAQRLANAPDDVLAFERTKGIASHSEIYAVDDLLKARPDANLSDFTVFTQEVKKASLRGEFKPACVQCNYLLDGVQYIK